MDNEELRLLSLDAENFHRLKIAKIRLDGEAGFVPITSDGENNQGKTAVLLAFCALVGGDGAVRPDVIHDGADGGWVRGEFSNGVRIEKRFTEAAPKGYLDVILPDATKPQKPQAYINEWLGEYALDPMAVFQLNKKRLRETLLSLSPDPELSEKIDAINAERASITEARKPWNAQKQRGERTKAPGGERPEAVDVSGEMERVKGLRATEERRANHHAAMDLSDRNVQIHQEREEETLAKIAQLQEDLEVIRENRATAQAAFKEARAARDRIPDTTEEVAAIEARISAADAVNEALAPWHDYERAKKEISEAKSKLKPMNDQLVALDTEESSLLAGSGIPVKGIGFAEDGTPLLNGKDLSVASGRERMEMALDMGFAANPHLKLILLDEANDLSLSAIRAVDERAKEKGFVVLACRLGLEGPGEIVVVDGVAENAS